MLGLTGRNIDYNNKNRMEEKLVICKKKMDAHARYCKNKPGVWQMTWAIIRVIHCRIPIHT